MCTCEGTGIKLNPAWERFYDWQSGQAYIDSNRLYYLIELVYFGGQLPPEFVACECQVAAQMQGHGANVEQAA